MFVLYIKLSLYIYIYIYIMCIINERLFKEYIITWGMLRMDINLKYICLNIDSYSIIYVFIYSYVSACIVIYVRKYLQGWQISIYNCV